MKVCTKCKFPKEDEEFNKNSSRKDGLNNICRICSNERSKKYYSENILHHRQVVNERKIKRITDNRIKLLEILKNSECKDCGTKDYRVFEFDHINNDKFQDVAFLLSTGYNWNKIKKEIDKCEIVCCNCHRLRTFTRSGNYRMLS